MPPMRGLIARRCLSPRRTNGGSNATAALRRLLLYHQTTLASHGRQCAMRPVRSAGPRGRDPGRGGRGRCRLPIGGYGPCADACGHRPTRRSTDSAGHAILKTAADPEDHLDPPRIALGLLAGTAASALSGPLTRGCSMNGTTDGSQARSQIEALLELVAPSADPSCRNLGNQRLHRNLRMLPAQRWVAASQEPAPIAPDPSRQAFACHRDPALACPKTHRRLPMGRATLGCACPSWAHRHLPVHSNYPQTKAERWHQCSATPARR